MHYFNTMTYSNTDLGTDERLLNRIPDGPVRGRHTAPVRPAHNSDAADKKAQLENAAKTHKKPEKHVSKAEQRKRDELDRAAARKQRQTEERLAASAKHRKDVAPIAEATADGKLQKDELKLFTGKSLKAVRSEIGRLEWNTIRLKEFTTDSQGGLVRTKHGERLEELRNDRQTGNDLDSLKSTIKQLDKGSSAYTKYQELIRKQEAKEGTIADGVKDKIQLRSTLVGEKLIRQQVVDANNRKIADLRDKAQIHLQTLAKQGGVHYDPSNNWADNAWDKTSKDYSFGDLVDSFRDDQGRLDDFVRKQPTETAKIAAEELGQIVRDYDKAADPRDAANRRIAGIAKERAKLAESIEVDRAVLSDSTNKGIDADLKSHLPKHDAPKSTERVDEKPAPGDTNKPVGTDGTPGNSDPNPVGGNGNPAPGNVGGTPNNTTGGGNGGNDDASSNKPVGEDQPGGTGTTTNPTTTAPTTTAPKKTADDVIRSKGGLGPAYTVKPNDNLWTIAKNYTDQYHVPVSWDSISAANKGKVDAPQTVGGEVYVGLSIGTVLTIPGIQEAIDKEVAAG